MTLYLILTWLLAVASAGYALGYYQPREGRRKAFLFFTTLFFTLFAFNWQPFHLETVGYRALIFTTCWFVSLLWLSPFLKVGRDAMERRVSKEVAFLRSLG